MVHHHWRDAERFSNKRAIFCNVYWSQLNLFSTTFLRVTGYATAILRLSRLYSYLKCGQKVRKINEHYRCYSVFVDDVGSDGDQQRTHGYGGEFGRILSSDPHNVTYV